VCRVSPCVVRESLWGYRLQKQKTTRGGKFYDQTKSKLVRLQKKKGSEGVGGYNWEKKKVGSPSGPGLAFSKRRGKWLVLRDLEQAKKKKTAPRRGPHRIARTPPKVFGRNAQETAASKAGNCTGGIKGRRMLIGSSALDTRPSTTGRRKKGTTKGPKKKRRGAENRKGQAGRRGHCKRKKDERTTKNNRSGISRARRSQKK